MRDDSYISILLKRKFAFQYHWYNNTQPENLPFLEELRALLDQYPDATTLGEISSEASLATMAEYCNDRRLHMGYSFELLTDDFSAAYIRATVERLEARMTQGWRAGRSPITTCAAR